MPTATTPRRRWFRFSLRSLLIFTVLVGLFMGWIVKERRQSAREWEIAKELDREGWAVATVGPFDAYESGQDQAWWRHLACRVIGERVHVVDTVLVSTDDVSLLAELPDLEAITANHTQIADLTPLAQLKNLERLSLHHTRVVDLTPLTGLTKLTYLDVTGTAINDEHIKALKKRLPKCKILHDPFPKP